MATPTPSIFLVFSDSHSKPEFNLGYAWITFWGQREQGRSRGWATRL